MRFLRRYSRGWYNDSYRHSLAAKGIRTSFSKKYSFQTKAEMEQLAQVDRVAQAAMADWNLGAEVNRARLEEMEADVKERRSPFSLGSRAQEERTEEIMGRAKVLGPFQQKLGRIESGVFDKAEIRELAKDKNPERQASLKRSAYVGLMSRAESGQSLDYGVMALLNNAQRKQIEQASRYAKTGQTAGRIKRAEEAIVGAGETVGLIGLETAGAGLKRGVQEMMKRGETPEEKLSRLQKERSAREGLKELEEEEEYGALSFGRISGLDQLIAERQAKKAAAGPSKDELEAELYPISNQVRAQVKSFWNHKENLAIVDMSAFKQGEKAFVNGDREGLADSIMDLEKEDMKLKDRWHLLQKTRGLVLSDDNRNETIARSSDNKNIIFDSFGGGAKELIDQTQKMAVMEKKIVEKSNLLNARIGHLKAKMRRLEALKPLIDEYPNKPIQLFGKSRSSGVLSMFDDFEGKLKHKNPVIDDFKKGDINPVFKK
jgi:hypothetical protein